jgi:hypothetical protein
LPKITKEEIMRPAKLWLLVILVSLAVTALGACSSGKNAPRVDKDTVKGWLDNPEVVILDVRAIGDWQASDRKIKGSVRQDPNTVKSWAESLPQDKKIVLYCA